MPDTYTSQFSGEEIDAALRAAQIISGASTPAELRKKLEIRGDTIPVSATDPTPISEALTTSGGGINPNLLDNWYFGNPVNQRGQTEYTGSAKCSIDRWLLQYDTHLSIVDGGVKLSGSWSIQQRFENTFPNATYNLSLLYKDKTGTDNLKLIFANLQNGDINQVSSGDANGLLSITVTTGDLNKVEIVFSGSADNSVTLLAAKLELGDTQTLAHQDSSGNWILNEIPDFGEQLRRCQRYFVRVGPGGNSPAGIGIYREGKINGWLPLPVEMRTIPSLSFNGSLFTVPDFHNVKFKNQDASTTRIIMYICELINSGETLPQVPYSLQCGTDSYIDISAEL